MIVLGSTSRTTYTKQKDNFHIYEDLTSNPKEENFNKDK